MDKYGRLHKEALIQQVQSFNDEPGLTLRNTHNHHPNLTWSCNIRARVLLKNGLFLYIVGGYVG